MPHNLETAGAVDTGSLDLLRGNSGQCRYVQDCAPAQALPQTLQNIDRREDVGIAHEVVALATESLDQVVNRTVVQVQQ